MVLIKAPECLYHRLYDLINKVLIIIIKNLIYQLKKNKDSSIGIINKKSKNNRTVINNKKLNQKIIGVW